MTFALITIALGVFILCIAITLRLLIVTMIDMQAHEMTTGVPFGKDPVTFSRLEPKGSPDIDPNQRTMFRWN